MIQIEKIRQYFQNDGCDSEAAGYLKCQELPSGQKETMLVAKSMVVVLRCRDGAAALPCR